MSRFVAPLPESLRRRPTPSVEDDRSPRLPFGALGPPPLHPSLRRSPSPQPPRPNLVLQTPGASTQILTADDVFLPNRLDDFEQGSSRSAPYGQSEPVLPSASTHSKIHRISSPLKRVAASIASASRSSLDLTHSNASKDTLQPDNLDESDEEQLSEADLRKLYDNEEIDRFLHLFSAYVNEVRLPEPRAALSPGSSTETIRMSPEISATDLQSEAVANAERDSDEESGHWVPIDVVPSEPVPPPTHESFSESIAFFISDHLPPPPPPAPPFTLGRLRLATQRLYLALAPTYLPFLARALGLASWRDRATSAKFCVLYWVLWSANLLLPAFILFLLYALLRRRLLPYPSLAELHTHREEVERSERIGAAVQARLSASSALGVREAWRMARVVMKGKKGLVASLLAEINGTAVSDREDRKEKRKSGGLLSSSREKFASSREKLGLGSSEEDDESEKSPPRDGLLNTANDVLETGRGDAEEQEQDLMRAGLQLMNSVADLHERVKNIFLWRRPAASRQYVILLILLFLATLLVPARYLAKAVYFTLGFLFWHVTPVALALPVRLPPPLADVPTDADYAMELIAERVANGLDVKPVKPKRRRKAESGSPGASKSSLDLGGALNMSMSTLSLGACPPQEDEPVSPPRLARRVKAFADDGRRLVRDLRAGMSPTTGSPLVPGIAFAHAQAAARTESHPFLAQHSKGPGLLTLTPAMLYFTPLVGGAGRKLAVPLPALVGVKKTGAVKGMTVKWTAEGGEERVERFLWVRGRDEAFARLIGARGRGEWLRV